LAAKSKSIGDIFLIYTISLRVSAGFKMISIPDGAELSGNHRFDPVVLAFRPFKLGNDPGQVISAEYIDDLLIGALGATPASGCC
jgi:hypothetical protein